MTMSFFFVYKFVQWTVQYQYSDASNTQNNGGKLIVQWKEL
jgi:hypothetical protein